MNNVGVTLAEEGHHAESKKMLRETLEIRRRVLGPEHPKTAETLYNLGPYRLGLLLFLVSSRLPGSYPHYAQLDRFRIAAQHH
jgi:hypothetical protein